MVIPIQWRPKYIEGYEGLYGVCRAGFVFNFKKWKFMNKKLNTNRYKYVTLYKQGAKQITSSVHRLVAEAFIPNQNNLPYVNHINEIKDDNRIENLEWCTASYNTSYGTSRERAWETRHERTELREKLKL